MNFGKPTKPIKKLLKMMASLKLAVFVLLSLGTITAWGTFVEAQYDATAAQKWVYHSVWMYSIMGLLATNLIGVMIDRWPWQKRHAGFVLAHIGIIILMIGSLVTSKFGIDGSISVGIGETAKHIASAETDLTVYASMDGANYRKIFDQEVDFFLHGPNPAHPMSLPIPTGSLKVVDYFPYAFSEEKVVDASGADELAKAGAAIRFQLQNDRVSLAEWLVQPGPARDAVKDLGPAQVVLTSSAFVGDPARNTLVLRPAKDGALEYEIRTARTPGKIRKGVAHAGDAIDTGWMGLVLRILKFLPQARQEVKFVPTDRPTPLTTAAIKVDYNGRVEWLSLNGMLKLFNDQTVYIVAYSNRRLDIGFPLTLKSFKVGRYPGTMRAASYESVIEAPVVGERVISMNEPMKYNGFTFYQSSFQEDERGRPVASIFSVNHDPGRWIKYLGCLFIVFGTIYLFYFKRFMSGKSKPVVS